jgi:hypothetical protein
VLFCNLPLLASRLVTSLIYRAFLFIHAMHPALAHFLRLKQCAVLHQCGYLEERWYDSDRDGAFIEHPRRR